jgi:hypothetical protein
MAIYQAKEKPAGRPLNGRVITHQQRSPRCSAVYPPHLPEPEAGGESSFAISRPLSAPEGDQMGNVPRSLGQSGRGGVGDQHLDRSTRASRASVALSHSSDDTTPGSWPYSLSLAMGLTTMPAWRRTRRHPFDSPVAAEARPKDRAGGSARIRRRCSHSPDP